MPEHALFNQDNYKDTIECPIWGTQAYFVKNAFGGEKAIFSPRASGFFLITDTSEAVLKATHLNNNNKIKATDWIIEQNRQGLMPTIPSVNFQDFLAQFSDNTRDIETRAKNLLKLFDEWSPHIGAYIPAVMKNSSMRHSLLAHTSSIDPAEVVFLAQMLHSDGLIIMQSSASGVFLPTTTIQPEGYNALSKMTANYKASKQVFVAMWFGKSVQPLYNNGIAPAIRDSGYDPVRIDGKEHNNKIDDEIIKEIKASKFLVADFTAEKIQKAVINGKEKDESVYLGRGGVYYEAGFAHGLGIPVIWTCREDCISDVHFDTRQYNHITYKTAEDLHEKLKNRIAATIK